MNAAKLPERKRGWASCGRAGTEVGTQADRGEECSEGAGLERLSWTWKHRVEPGRTDAGQEGEVAARLQSRVEEARPGTERRGRERRTFKRSHGQIL